MLFRSRLHDHSNPVVDEQRSAKWLLSAQNMVIRSNPEQPLRAERSGDAHGDRHRPCGICEPGCAAVMAAVTVLTGCAMAGCHLLLPFRRRHYGSARPFPTRPGDLRRRKQTVTQVTNRHGACMLARMVKLLARWFLLAAALLLTAHFYPGIQVRGYGAALVAALILGLLNTVLRPVLVVLTLTTPVDRRTTT